MLKNTFLYVILFTFINSITFAQKINYCLTKEEAQLLHLINIIRTENNKPLIPISFALCITARMHVYNLSENKASSDLRCWYENAKKENCYSENEFSSKPQVFTNYKGEALEIVVKTQNASNPWAIYSMLKKDIVKLSIVLSNGKWSKYEWNALGVALYKDYVSIWFGEAYDKNDPPTLCKEMDDYSKKPDELTEQITGLKNGEQLNADNKKQKIEKMNISKQSYSPNTKNNSIQNNIVNKKDSLSTIPSSDKKSFFIIYGSYNSYETANTAANQLIEKGYKNTRVLISNSKYRVSLDYSNDENQIYLKYKELKSDFPNCWILSQ